MTLPTHTRGIVIPEIFIIIDIIIAQLRQFPSVIIRQLTL